MSSLIQGNFNHIPYKGTAPVIQDLSGGQIDFAIQPFQNSMLSLEEEGRFKILAILSDDKPAPLKNKPSITEAEPFKDFNYQSVAAYFVKKGTPPEIIQTLNTAIANALKDPEAVKSLESDGRVVSKPVTIAQADALYQAEIKKYQQIIQDSGFQPAN